jgi:4-hydroxybenzoyl-CoA thioesterase
MTKTWETTRVVRFADCDPAGIVFFPRYFEMANTLVERWYGEALGIDYAEMIARRRTGLPTVRIEVDFTAISRHGETLRQRLAVEKLGRTSLILRHRYFGGDEQRLSLRQVLVCTSLETHRPQPLPEDMRAAIAQYAEVVA